MVNMALKGVKDVINEIRSMSRTLVPHTLKDLGLVESILELTEVLRQTQLLQTHFDYSGFEEEQLPENQKLTLFRIAQEQFNNIVKHAEASSISIKLRSDLKGVTLEIQDDGKGFDPANRRKGLGFTNIRNRVELFGGKKELVAQPGKGCSLRIFMPALPVEPAV
jgi:signal transduction histidine kinase